MVVYYEIFENGYTAFQHFGLAFASIFLLVGQVTLAVALVHGKAGPAQALLQLQCVFTLFWEIVVFRRLPNLKEVIGMTLGIIGASIMS